MTEEDSGNMLGEKDVERIFDPLYTTKQKGTGLGLATCKNKTSKTASNQTVF